MQVTAIDLDTGNNARLTYRIVGGDQIPLVQQQQHTKQQQKLLNKTSTSSSSSASTLALSTSMLLASQYNSAGENPLELFGIQPNSGWLFLRGTLDRETRDRYNITVLASDNGTPSLSATTHVIVNVLDANDNDPIFSRNSYEFSVEENLRRGHIVGTILATDADIGENAAIRYSLIPSNTSFHINPITGNSYYD